jgi:hypothetical protein
VLLLLVVLLLLLVVLPLLLVVVLLAPPVPVMAVLPPPVWLTPPKAPVPLPVLEAPPAPVDVDPEAACEAPGPAPLPPHEAAPHDTARAKQARGETRAVTVGRRWFSRFVLSMRWAVETASRRRDSCALGTESPLSAGEIRCNRTASILSASKGAPPAGAPPSVVSTFASSAASRRSRTPERLSTSSPYPFPRLPRRRQHA